MYVYVYVYVYVRVHIHIHTLTPAQALLIRCHTIVYRSSVVRCAADKSCLLGVSARTDINNPKEDALQDFILGSPDDSGE